VVVGVDLLVVPLGHVADVSAGRKGLLVAGDDDGADVRIGVEPGERRGKLSSKRIAQRVHALRAIEAYHADAVAGFDQDVPVAHRVSFGWGEFEFAATSSRAAAIAARSTPMSPT